MAGAAAAALAMLGVAVVLGLTVGQLEDRHRGDSLLAAILGRYAYGEIFIALAAGAVFLLGSSPLLAFGIALRRPGRRIPPTALVAMLASSSCGLLMARSTRLLLTMGVDGLFAFSAMNADVAAAIFGLGVFLSLLRAAAWDLARGTPRFSIGAVFGWSLLFGPLLLEGWVFARARVAALRWIVREGVDTVPESGR